MKRVYGMVIVAAIVCAEKIFGFRMKRVYAAIILAAIVCAVAILGLGCASFQHAQECNEIRPLFIKMPECATGWGMLGITGHPPVCADEHTATVILDMCPGFE